MAFPQHRIFVSHSSKDHDFCLRLIDDLQQALGDENAVWYDARGGLHGGDTWWRKIEHELETRNTFIVVLSPDAIASPWVNDEIDIAWSRKNSPDSMRIIPLLYRECQIRASLRSLQIINFVEPKSYRTAFQELLAALGLTSNTGKQPINNPSPSTVTTQKTRDQWFKEGNDHVEAKRYREGIEAYTQAIRLDPNYAKAYYNRGNAYDDLKEYQKAIADYDQAIRLDPNYARAYYNRGNTYKNLNEYERAIADYDQAIRLNPNYALAYNNRGLAYRNLKEYQKAIADYDHAIRLDPNHTLAKENREEAYRLLRNR